MLIQTELMKAATDERDRLYKEDQRLREVARNLEGSCFSLQRQLDGVKEAVL